MEQVEKDINTLVLKDEPDAKGYTGGNVIGAQDAARDEQTTHFDAKQLDIVENVGDIEALDDGHGAASTDARMLGCLGTTDSVDKVNIKK